MTDHRDEDRLPRVFIEHDEPVALGSPALTEDERAFRRWMEQRADFHEPEAGLLDDDDE